MQKIVDKGIKVDLHIHSYYSKAKDKDKVQNGTIDNLPILVNGLVEQQVEMCAITDHDTFNYEIYKKLKEEEDKDNCIKKVLPGIEFSVEFVEGVKSIHIVTIFNDSDDEKVKKIEEVMNSEHGKFRNKKDCYTKAEYYEILNEINLDFVMIAHQKKSLLSSDAKKHDVMSLGEKLFNEYVFMDYFDAFEFRSKKNEIYNKVYSEDKGLSRNMRFITGSDCHRWEYYPYTEKGEKEDYGFTYIKSLPTFRGLVMAITEPHRISISCNFYNPMELWIESLEMKIDNKDVSIPMSKGINVIIGDNSVGKSLLLNALTDYQKIKESSLKKGYEKYLNRNHIEIKKTIQQSEIFMFNSQGEIRGIFDSEGMRPNTYLKQFKPENPIDANKYRKIVEKEFERLYKALEGKFSYDENVRKLSTFSFFLNEIEDKNLSVVGSVGKKELGDLQKLIQHFENVISEIRDNILTNKALKDSDKEHIKNSLEIYEMLRIKYIAELDEIKMQNVRINIFNTYMKEWNKDYRKRNSTEQALYSDFLNNLKNTSKDICNLMKQKLKIQEFSFNVDSTKVIPETNPVDKYQFVSKISVEQIDNQYLQNVLASVLAKKAEIKVKEITSEKLCDIILRYNDDDTKTPLEVLEEKISSKLDKDFKIIDTVIENNMDAFDQLSAGFDAQTYFSLICGEERNKGIYLIDQPEDHISQKAINKNVIEQFRKMGSYRQVIMVTHNPQFIVNLDVDNVIFLTKQNGKFEILSGALEYADDEYNILNIVADNIEGGLQTILGRMKRYEKNI